jgi:hypothetical protein
MAKGDPVTSPYVWDSGGDFQGNHITLTWVFDNATRALITGTVHRDAGCVFTKIYVGVGGDGSPNTTTHVFDVGNLVGDRTFTANQMAAIGFTTIEQVLALQITAGP